MFYADRSESESELASTFVHRGPDEHSLSLSHSHSEMPCIQCSCLPLVMLYFPAVHHLL